LRGIEFVDSKPGRNTPRGKHFAEEKLGGRKTGEKIPFSGLNSALGDAVSLY